MNYKSWRKQQETTQQAFPKSHETSQMIKENRESSEINEPRGKCFIFKINKYDIYLVWKI